ncbi:hypothetical protein [Aporhodopirellula aestuarii]|uniref:Secreted protein n=1 Tax=Aporhodopirellula aestuarii TaxID=2950107 RepID=A0ABT0U711_9BACT|nr:hypothetical protein [Aporhodopirellula aestuarii]MCM2372676.1 hypothetical protein [Aporhodopirellula aestuarii]
MKPICFLLVLSFASLVPITGCSDSQPVDVTENADEEALLEYRRMVAESQAKSDKEEKETK